MGIRHAIVCLFKPWLHPKEAKRARAMQKIKDPALLVSYARNDPSTLVRDHAIEEITDEDVLIDILVNSKYRNTMGSLVARLTRQRHLETAAGLDLHAQQRETIARKLLTLNNDNSLEQPFSPSVEVFLLKNGDAGLCRALLEETNNLEALRIFATGRHTHSSLDPDGLEELLRIALDKFESNDDLLFVAQKLPGDAIACEAVRRLTDVEPIKEVAIRTSGEVTAVAIGKIEDEEVLADLIPLMCDTNARLTAANRITRQDLMKKLVLAKYRFSLNAEEMQVLFAKRLQDKKMILEAAKECFAAFKGKVNTYSAEFVELLKKVHDQEFLGSVGKNNRTRHVCRAVVANLTDKAILASVIDESRYTDFCEELANSTDDEEILVMLTKRRPRKQVGFQAGGATVSVDHEGMLQNTVRKKLETLRK